MYKLWFGARPPGDTGIPHLPPYYSYLLRLAPGVSVVDIYPWLAELLFFSAAVDSNGSAESSGRVDALNVVGFFIDEHQHNISATMGLPAEGKEPYFQSADPFRAYKKWTKEKFPGTNGKSHFPRHFLVDTFGSFGDSNEPDIQPTIAYHAQSVPGSGNPMLLMRAFRKIANEQGGHRSPKFPLGALNLFVINSITYLYRTMGFRDAMLFVREILKEGVWKPGLKSNPTKRLLDKDGMLFAIMHAGVFDQEETKYAETFFDGILVFERKPEDSDDTKTIRYWWKRLPPLACTDTTPLVTKRNARCFRVASGLGRIPEGGLQLCSHHREGASTAPTAGGCSS